MFSQLQFVRLRAAEKSLRDGNLDEAFRLAAAPDLADHRRAKTVLASLTERYLERARAQFREDHFSEALSDLDRAERAGVLKDEIAELRRNVQIVAAEVRRQDHSRRGRMDAARRRVEQGSLAAGKRLLDQAGAHDPTAEKMKEDVQQRTEEAAGFLAQAEQLLRDGQFAAVASRLQRAARLDAHNERVAVLEAELCRRVLDSARSAIVEGRLARASDELTGLGPLGRDFPARRELADALAAAREAAAAVRSNRFADARRHAMALQRLVPAAKWVSKVAEQLRQMDEMVTSVATGPLGDRIDAGVPGARQADRAGPAGVAARAGGGQPVRPMSPDDTVALPWRSGTGQLPARLLLLVEGGGSYLILRGPRASIGRAASHTPADMVLFSDISERHANIERVDEDYFVFSGKELEVGGRKVQHTLLRDGDRVVLGRKAKFTFRLPSRRSTTAVLDLSDTTKMPNDVRRVVLLDRHAMLGDGSHAHVRCRHAGPPLLLVEQDGALWIRQRNDGHVDTEAKPLRLGEPVEIGGASIVLSEWKSQGTGIV